MNTTNKIIIALASLMVVFGAVAVIDDSSAADITTIEGASYTDNYYDIGLIAIEIEFGSDVTGSPMATLSNDSGFSYENQLGTDTANPTYGVLILEEPLTNGTYTLSIANTASCEFEFEDGIITILTDEEEVPGETGYTVTYEAENDYGTVSVADADGTVESGATVADGTELTVTFTPDADADVTAVTVNGNAAVEDADGNWVAPVTVDGADLEITVAVTIGSGTTDPEPEQPDEDENPDDTADTTMEDMYVNGTYYSATTVFYENQRVIVDGTLIVTASMEIRGQLVVPAGSSVVIEDGGSLTFTNGNVAATEGVVASISGTVTVEEDGEVVIQSGTVTVDGELDVYGDMTVSGTLQIDEGGTAVVEEGGSVDGQSVIVYGEIDVYGSLGATDVENYGTVVFDSEESAANSVHIYMMTSGAVVDVRGYTSDGNATMTIDDSQLIFRESSSGNTTVENHDGVGANTVTVTVGSGDGYVTQVSGLTVTAGASGTSARYTNTLYVSGSLGVSAVYTTGTSGASVSATVALDTEDGRNYIAVSETLTVGANVTVDNNGDLTVSGTVTATATNSTLSNEGVVDISGDGIITMLTSKVTGFETETGIVNATKYASGSNTVYVTVDAALATVNAEGNTITQLTLLGENTVTVSATLPTDVVMQTAGASLYIGEENGSDVVLTIAEGASVRGAATVIDVRGTLYAEDKSDIQSSASERIVADVYSEEIDENGRVPRDGWARWTNIYTAMAEAEAGDVVYVDRDATLDGEAQYVSVSQNLTIPTDVTLIVASDKAPLLLSSGVTLTINGTLQTAVDVYAENMFGTTATNVSGNTARQSSAVVVNGYLYTTEGTNYANSVAVEGSYAAMSAGAPIAGVYYEVGSYAVISPLEQAIAVIGEVGSEMLTVNGQVTAGDIAFAVEDGCDVIYVADSSVYDMNNNLVVTSLTVSSLTLDGTSVQAVGAVTGTVVVDDAEVDLDAVTGLTLSDSEGMSVTGASGYDEDASIAFAAGSSSVSASINIAATVETDATVVSSGAYFADLAVDGTVEISDSGTSRSVDAGTITVSDGGLVNVDANETLTAGYVYVYGTLAVAESTSTTNPGYATVEYTLGVGISAEDIEDGVAGTSGTVTGSVSVMDEAYVSSAATVSDDTLSPFRYVTDFEVEGSVWFTLYNVSADSYLLPEKAPLENAVLIGWEAEDGTDYTYPQYYPVSSYSVLTAIVDYEIYDVVITADAGIGSIAIDGMVLYNMGNVYMIYGLTAGSHTVTYTLASGYEGSATLSTTSGDYVSVSGLSFTLSGTDPDNGYVTVYLSLSGTSASDSSIVVNVDNGDDDGMSITDWLLVVLVILIIIMAIIVALRLRRS